MSLKQILTFVFAVIVGIAMALPEPHNGMVDNDHVRDVGVIYSKPNFQGDKKFVFEVKDGSGCQPFGGDMLSIMICKPDIQCNFYTGRNCDANKDNYAVGIGCGDAAQVSTPKGNHFNYYRCAKAGSVGNVNHTVKTVPHNSAADAEEGMGN